MVGVLSLIGEELNLTTKLDKVLRAYRGWQEQLAANPNSDECGDHLHRLYRLLKLAPPFDAPELEQLHREAYPDPRTSPPRLVATVLRDTSCLE